jgi:hypothetical protein
MVTKQQLEKELQKLLEAIEKYNRFIEDNSK